MNIKMNRKKIRVISWITEDGEQVLNTNPDRILSLSATYHGDRDEFWVIETDKTGKEVARYNCKTIDSIAWD